MWALKDEFLAFLKFLPFFVHYFPLNQRKIENSKTPAKIKKTVFLQIYQYNQSFIEVSGKNWTLCLFGTFWVVIDRNP